MKYRPEIDGLRAVAVVPVILFHAGFSMFGGGYVGVDVFFVISGYLITSIIHREISERRFSLVHFYERRARRILPALTLVCLATLPFAWLWLLPSELEDFGQALAAVSVFSSNILFWLTSGYFATAAELLPLLHTWSLAIEEQFYVLFPLLMLLLAGLSRNRLSAFLFVASLGSLAAAHWMSSAYPSAGFFLLPTRAWELGAGGILALSGERSAMSQTVRGLCAAAGLLMIAAAVVFYDQSTPFPSLYALMPVMGTVIVIACADSGNRVGRLLAWPALVGIGLISYSAYLWHQPVLALARSRSLDEMTELESIGLVVLSLSLAFISWRFIEAPFRDKTRVSRGAIFAFSGVAMVVLMAIGLGIYYAEGVPSRLSQSAQSVIKWRPDRNPRRDECLAPVDGPIESHCYLKWGKRGSIAVWGDSHADPLAWQLAELAELEDVAIQQLTRNGCAPVIDVDRQPPVCIRDKEKIFAYLQSAQSPDIVILAARWALNFTGQRFDNREGGVEPGPENRKLWPLSDAGAGSEHARMATVADALRREIASLIRSGKRVVFVHQIPEAGWDVPKRMALLEMLGKSDGRLTTSYDVYRSRNADYKALLAERLRFEQNFVEVNPAEVFCSRITERCDNEMNGKPLYTDDDHLSSIGAHRVAEQIHFVIKRRGWLR